ncbi:MAG TPA: hypothetical protein VFV87_08250 [Pirellulaceae bacterium]|nr:hypothetical protein [Pirellulaceae bacterium]
MRFQGLFTSAQPAAVDRASRLSLLEKVSRLMDEAANTAPSKSLNGLDAMSARVKLAAGEFTITAAPASEPTARGASYAMFDVESIVEAILWTKCFLQVLGEGECEIRPLCAA